MREVHVEGRLVRRAKAAGGVAHKWVSPNFSGLPDRIVLLPVPPEHCEIVNRYVKLVETKAPGKVPGARQVFVHGQLRALGYEVHVPDSMEDVDAIFA
jgi:hypothetical protein